MTPARAYWTGVGTLFASLLVVGLLPMVGGLPLLVLILWAVAQGVKGRWDNTPLGRWLRGSPPEGRQKLWNDGPRK